MQIWPEHAFLIRAGRLVKCGLCVFHCFKDHYKKGLTVWQALPWKLYFSVNVKTLLIHFVNSFAKMV